MTQLEHPRILVVLGGTGFIGGHFLSEALACGWSVRALTRSERLTAVEGLQWVRGDMRDPAVWQTLLVRGCVVVNLAHAQKAVDADAVATTSRFLEACARAGATRMVHCSSASVFGRAAMGDIDERTRCEPLSAYGRHKLAVEEVLFDSDAGAMEITVLRPTAVFGPGGAALRTLATSLAHGSRLQNYLRSSLFGHRRMHLVPVGKVVSALSFLCTIERRIHREVFIVGDDVEPLNNFRDVESLLMTALGVPAYSLPRLPVPSWLFRLALYARGRDETDPNCRYSSKKLCDFGFANKGGFESALRDYIALCSAELK